MEWGKKYKLVLVVALHEYVYLCTIAYVWVLLVPRGSVTRKERETPEYDSRMIKKWMSKAGESGKGKIKEAIGTMTTSKVKMCVELSG